jgi:hypothetical protein
MVIRDLYICDCECHEPHSGMMHCVPCCTVCPHCRRNVTNLKWHLEHCSHNKAAGEIDDAVRKLPGHDRDHEPPGFGRR